MTFEEATNYIELSSTRGSILGLSRMKKLLELLGNPDRELKIIHIAGTNGKGSTSCFISNILTKAGFKTGMYYSPALEGVKDHYRINGEIISDSDYTKCVETISRIIDANFEEDLRPTQFEIETAIAFLYMRDNKCDFMILETGLGGREDATNAIEDKVMCVFTSISMDHMNILGDNLYNIAKCKAGIIKNNAKVVAFDSGKEVIKALQEEADIYGCKLHIVKKEVAADGTVNVGNVRVVPSLKGTFQRDNARVAISAVMLLRDIGVDINDEAIIEGISTAKWPYRFEQICDCPLVYVDGAHNDDAAIRLRDTILEEFPDEYIIMLLGMFKDKEYDKVISTLAPLADEVYAITTLNEQRALDGNKIASIARKYCAKSYACDSIEGAYISAVDSYKSVDDNGVIIACGSLSYLSEFKKIACKK